MTQATLEAKPGKKDLPKVLCVRARLKSIAPYGQGKKLQSEYTADAGTHDDFEKAHWRERMHVDDHGVAFIPPSAFKGCLMDVCKFLAEKIPGRGNNQYGKHFTAGVMIAEGISLGVTAADAKGTTVNVPANGKRGNASRVDRTFPTFAAWEGELTIYLTDPILIANPEKVREYLEYAGRLVGIGTYRPYPGGGYWGRFEVLDFAVIP